ncbi:MAG: hypothetical protein ISR48_03305 [Alphaproteobacteria bacterium]|nr:hypothetical protein [Alphaproteobacteria bacterium]
MMKTETLVALLVGVALIFAAITALLLSFSDVSNVPSGTPDEMAIPEVQSGNASPKPVISGSAVAKEPSSVTPMGPAVGPQWWVFISLSVMAIVTLAAVAISFYLYRWRGILLSNPHLVVPEEFGAWINDLSKRIGGFTQEVASGIGNIGDQGRETHQGIANLSETFMTMQGALDEREEEIRRLKKGYDAHIYRKFVSRFIRVDQTVEDFQRAGGADQTGLEQIRRLLGDSFAECGVECFQPQIGEDYRKADGIADKPKTVKADRPEDDFKIAEVLESGYLIRSTEGAEVIIPAKVRIYMFQEGEAS